MSNGPVGNSPYAPDSNGLISLHIIMTGGTGTHRDSCYYSKCCGKQPNSIIRTRCFECDNDLSLHRCFTCKKLFCPKCLFYYESETKKSYPDHIRDMCSCMVCLYRVGGEKYNEAKKDMD